MSSPVITNQTSIDAAEHRLPGEEDSPSAETHARLDWKRIATSSMTSWCLSLLLHLTAYTVAALIFAWLGLNLLPAPRPTDVVPAIQASLADETIIAELPALIIVPSGKPDSTDSPQMLQQLASQLAVADRGQLETVVTDAKIAATGSDESDAGEADRSPFFRIPESGLAVTKGSFTAWTSPAHPAPGEMYQIIIEMRLPAKLSRYRISDLSGEVIGTDGYRQRLPYDSRKPAAARVTGGAEYETVRRNMKVKITGKKLQLAIRVPGAERLVRDQIRIKSKRLGEEQELTLVFGRRPESPGLED